MKADRHALGDVNSAAGKLAGQARTISARHLAHGMAREQFNREVAYYAKRVVEDVARGYKTPQQGIQALLKEQRDLLIQSQAVTRKARNAITDRAEGIPPSRHIQPVSRPDPQRLLRFVHEQNLKTANANTPDTLKSVSSSHPAPDFEFFPRERWPAAVPAPEEPGFYVVPRSTTVSRLEAQLFASASPAAIAKFNTLNPNLDQVKAGTMIVLSDPNNHQCTREEALLMAAASKVNKALEPLSPEEADFMARHHDEIAFLLSKGSLGASAGLAMFSKNLDNVSSILRDIEALHTRTFQANGHLNSPEFYAQRKSLLTQLDSQLTQLTKKSIGGLAPTKPDTNSLLN